MSSGPLFRYRIKNLNYIVTFPLWLPTSEYIYCNSCWWEEIDGIPSKVG